MLPVMPSIRSIALLILFTLFATHVHETSAQVTDAEKDLRTQKADSIGGWITGGITQLNFSQSSFTYWSAGGQNSIGLNGLLSLHANYEKNRNAWDNLFDFGYGVIRQGKGDFIKIDDKIDLFSKYGRKATEHWYYSALANFKTQLRPGYDYSNDSTRISNFLAPAYVLGAVGMDYKPSSNVTAFISPLTGRLTMVNDQHLSDTGAFGVTPGKRFRGEFGGYVRVMYSTTLFSDKSVSVLTKMDVFSNYLKEPAAIDVSWETIVGFKINRFMSATLTTHVLYDKDIDIAIDKNSDGIPESIGPKVQFKQVLGIGFTYQF